MIWAKSVCHVCLVIPAFAVFTALFSHLALADHQAVFADKLSRSMVCADLPAPDVSCELITRYAITLSDDQVQHPHVIVVSGFRGDPAIRLNGTQLILPFSTRSDLLIRGGPPIQIPLAGGALKSGVNDLVVTVVSEALMGPYPGSVAIFEEDHGGDEYTNALWHSIMLARISDGIVLALCMIAVGIGLVAQRPQIYFCFAAVCLCWLLTSSVNFLPKSFSTSAAMTLNVANFIGGMLWTPLLLMIANYVIPRWLWALCVAIPVLVYGVIWTVDDQLIVRAVISVTVLLILLMALYALILVIRRGRSFLISNSIWFGLALVVITMGLSRFSEAVTIEGLFPPVRSFAFFLAVVSLGVALIRRFLTDFADINAQKDQLRVAVESAQAEILTQVEANQKQQSIIVKQAERQRLMSDLHDGVAGHLLTISSLSRPSNPEPDLGEIRQVSQAAIVDLRLIVDSLDEQVRTLKDCLLGFQSRATQFAQAAGFSLKFRLDPAMGNHPIAQAEALDVARILQELINNAIRHSDGSEVQMTVAEESQDRIRIEMTDNGTSAPDMSVTQPGVGMRSMFRRAERIGAAFTISRSQQGGVSAALVLDTTLLGVSPS